MKEERGKSDQKRRVPIRVSDRVSPLSQFHVISSLPFFPPPSLSVSPSMFILLHLILLKFLTFRVMFTIHIIIIILDVDSTPRKGGFKY